MYLLLSETDVNQYLSIGNKCIDNSNEEKILGVTFDNKFNYNSHISKLCKSSSQKLHAIARVSNFMSQKQRLCIMNHLSLPTSAIAPSYGCAKADQ